MTEVKKDIFNVLSALNVNDKTEKKGDLTYLSWAWAWKEFRQAAPSARFEVVMFDGKPYINDPETGYMVFTNVTVEDETHPMWLPVMDYKNDAMRSEPYTYEVLRWNKEERKKVPVSVQVEKCSMMDINKAIMRCLTKNLAMFGLGLYIYSGDDLPSLNNQQEKEAEEQRERDYQYVVGLIDKCQSREDLEALSKNQLRRTWQSFQKDNDMVRANKLSEYYNDVYAACLKLNQTVDEAQDDQ